MPKTFQVPVWFNIEAETQEEAERKMSEFLFPFAFPMDYVVSDAVLIPADTEDVLDAI